MADAEESLEHGEPDARILYSAARTIAQAADAVAKDSRAAASATLPIFIVTRIAPWSYSLRRLSKRLSSGGARFARGR